MAFPEYHEETLDGRIVYVCDECGSRRTPGDWMQCPHLNEKGSFGEDPLEPYFDEHITERGEYITSRGQRRTIMNANHLEYRKKRTDLLTGQRTYFDQGRRG